VPQGEPDDLFALRTLSLLSSPFSPVRVRGAPKVRRRDAPDVLDNDLRLQLTKEEIVKARSMQVRFLVASTIFALFSLV
jgi:hypothetical protein